MPRSPRIVVGGGIYHIFVRGNNAQQIFLDNVDRYHYLRLLQAASKRLAIGVLAYVLMSNHVHLVLQVTTPNLATVMHLVHRAYAFRFNRRHGRIGHTFNNRFQSLPIVDDVYLLQSTRYIHLNPVDAGLVDDPGDYPWSSYRQYLAPRDGQLVTPNPVLSLLGNDPVRCRRAYEEFVTTDLSRDRRMVGSRA